MKIIGMSEDSQKNVTAPFFKFINLCHEADPRRNGTIIDFANVNTAFSPSQRSTSSMQKGHSRLWSCWFCAASVAWTFALILTMAFSQARVQEPLLIGGFTPYYQMCAQPLPSGADAFIGQLVMDLPVLEFIRKAPVLSSWFWAAPTLQPNSTTPSGDIHYFLSLHNIEPSIPVDCRIFQH